MHKFLGQAQASPKANRAHLAAAHERETQPIGVTHHRSKAIPPRPIRRVHKDLRAHQSYQTDLRQAQTNVHDMSAHLAAFRPRTEPNGRSPWPADHVVMAHGPHRLGDDMWHLVVGAPWRFGFIPGVAPSYKYEGRGEN